MKRLTSLAKDPREKTKKHIPSVSSIGIFIESILGTNRKQLRIAQYCCLRTRLLHYVSSDMWRESLFSLVYITNWDVAQRKLAFCTLGLTTLSTPIFWQFKSRYFTLTLVEPYHHIILLEVYHGVWNTMKSKPKCFDSFSKNRSKDDIDHGQIIVRVATPNQEDWYKRINCLYSSVVYPLHYSCSEPSTPLCCNRETRLHPEALPAHLLLLGLMNQLEGYRLDESPKICKPLEPCYPL